MKAPNLLVDNLMMNRRVFLRNANMAAVSLAASGGLAGCVKRPVAAATGMMMVPENLPVSACHLPPVHIAPEREIRTVVGLRPFRPSGFRVAKEMVGEIAVVASTMGTAAVGLR